MSLNYDLSAIRDWQELTPGAIECMAFMSMFVGRPVIAADGPHDWREFDIRAREWEAVNGPIRADGQPLGTEVIWRFIGLRTNASPLTKAQFHKQLTDKLRRDAEREADKAQREKTR